MLFILGLSVLFIALQLSTTASAASNKRIKLDLKFGVKENRCHGFGICLIYDPGVRFEGEYSALSLEDELLFLKSRSVNQKKILRHSKDQLFLWKRIIVLPVEISRQLGYEYELVIPKGKHRLIKSSDSYRIEFKLH